MSDDTIVAVSSPAGRAARAIVRLSGPQALDIAFSLCAAPPNQEPGTSPSTLLGVLSLPKGLSKGNQEPRSFRFVDGSLTIPGAAGVPARLYLMRAPRSYTRQDVVELHLPGSPIVTELALEAALAAGARLAEPGEFTRRALENGRISADQAEAVIGVIRARSRSELAAAAGGLSGRAGRELAAWRARAEELAARMEAELDYGEAAGEFLDDESAAQELAALGCELDRFVGRDISDGADAAADAGAVRAVLAGPVNAGKSLLFSRLTGQSALVSAVPGTTRDVREAPLACAPRDVAILDTAGLGAPAGEVELLARAAAEHAWRCADLLLLVADRSDPTSLERLRPAAEAARAAEIPAVLVINKSDRPAAGGFLVPSSWFLVESEQRNGNLAPGLQTRESTSAPGPGPLNQELGTRNQEPLHLSAVLEVSALTGAGCSELGALLAELVRSGRVERSTGRIAAAFRRREVLARARSSLRAAAEALEDGLGLACAADDLRTAAREVARHFEPGAGRAELDEAVINRIFARFCVGK